MDICCNVFCWIFLITFFPILLDNFAYSLQLETYSQSYPTFQCQCSCNAGLIEGNKCILIWRRPPWVLLHHRIQHMPLWHQCWKVGFGLWLLHFSESESQWSQSLCYNFLFKAMHFYFGLISLDVLDLAISFGEKSAVGWRKSINSIYVLLFNTKFTKQIWQFVLYYMEVLNLRRSNFLFILAHCALVLGHAGRRWNLY